MWKTEEIGEKKKEERNETAETVIEKDVEFCV